MKTLLVAILLSLPLSGAWAANAYHKIFSDEYGTQIKPHAVLYSTYTQAMTDGAAAQYLELNSNYHKYGFTQINKSTWSTNTAGVYQFCFSGIADLAALPAARMEVRLRVDNVDVPDSNTIVQLNTASIEYTVAMCILSEMQAGSTFNFMSYSADTDMHWLYTAAGSTPTRPATPSIIVSAWKISGIE